MNEGETRMMLQQQEGNAGASSPHADSHEKPIATAGPLYRQKEI